MEGPFEKITPPSSFKHVTLQVTPEDLPPARGKGSPGAQCRGAKPCHGNSGQAGDGTVQPISVQAVHPQSIRVCIYSRYKLLCEGTWSGRAVSARREGFLV